ncbi:hypothetical protein F5Y10DRAFT_166788 [Nemania abortiva]|nr:hypothetical protein F5Y10DRAFT_166788 [Nemania abortiva]
MGRIKFEHQARPPPIRLGSAGPEYVKTPYPTQSVALASPCSLSTSMTDESRIYYLSQGHPPPELSGEISDFFRKWSPLEEVNVSCSLLTITSQWELRLPHPLLCDSGSPGCAHAHHVYVKFPPAGPSISQWGAIAKELRENVLSKHDMLGAAIEFTMPGEYGNISAWYPPGLEKEKLMAFFEDDSFDELDSDLELDDLEEQSDSITVQITAPHRKDMTNSNEIRLPLLEVHAPGEIDIIESATRAADVTSSNRGRETSPRILVESR